MFELIEQKEPFIKKIMWKAINNIIKNCMKDNSKNNGEGIQKENSSKYGLKSIKSPPLVKNLMGIGEDMIDLIHKIRFCNVKDNFQRKLNLMKLIILINNLIKLFP